MTLTGSKEYDLYRENIRQEYTGKDKKTGRAYTGSMTIPDMEHPEYKTTLIDTLYKKAKHNELDRLIEIIANQDNISCKDIKSVHMSSATTLQAEFLPSLTYKLAYTRILANYSILLAYR
jgi:hypothetical protein